MPFKIQEENIALALLIKVFSKVVCSHNYHSFTFSENHAVHYKEPHDDPDVVIY